MLFKKSPAAAAAAEIDTPQTVIGKGVYLEAVRLTGQESIRISGVFKGSIDVDGSLVLDDTGSITGDVSAKYFLVAGEVNGNIKCSTQLHFASTAKVTGDIQTSSLIMDEGSHVSGRYMVGGDKITPELLQGREESLRIQSSKVVQG